MALSPRYKEWSLHLRALFGGRVQKLSVDAGFSCPNRDGRVGHAGCAYCSNEAFSAGYARAGKTIREQLEEGKAFFSHKGPCSGYLAYFGSYSNTYALLPVLRKRYEEALGVEGVRGLVIATRPDCVDEAVLDLIASFGEHCYVQLEYGIESLDNEALSAIGRGHTVEQALWAVRETARRGIPVCGHFIVGLPGERPGAWNDYARKISSWPLDVLKMHQLQVLRHTPLAVRYEQDPLSVSLLEAEEYIRILAEFLSRLRSDIFLERFLSTVPPRYLVAPHWGLKAEAFHHKLERYMEERGLWQGIYYNV